MAIETFKENGFTVTIDYDQDSGSDNPRDWDNASVFVLSHREYNWSNESGINLDNYNGWDEVTKVLEADHDAAVVWPVYAYVHSGTAFRLGTPVAYSDHWDSGIAGVIYITNRALKEEWTGNDQERITNAKACAEGELETYQDWCNGAVYEYSISDFDGEVVDLGSGIYGLDYCESEARSTAKNLEHEKKCHGNLNRTTGEIDHEKDCEIHQ
jgi:hypothetical protein